MLNKIEFTEDKKRRKTGTVTDFLTMCNLKNVSESNDDISSLYKDITSYTLR